MLKHNKTAKQSYKYLHANTGLKISWWPKFRSSIIFQSRINSTNCYVRLNEIASNKILDTKSPTLVTGQYSPYLTVHSA